MNNFGVRRQLYRLAIAAAMTGLLLAACAPASPTASTAPTELFPTGQATTGGAATGLAPTELAPTGQATTGAGQATAMPSEASTSSASTQSTTAMPSEAATGQSSAQGTAQGTAQANGALLIDTNHLIGLPVVDSRNSAAGTVADVLVNVSGTIQSVVVNLNGAASSAGALSVGTPAAGGILTPGTPSALTPPASTAVASTPVAGTPAANAPAYVAVAWSQFNPDPSNNRLVYQGASSGLMGSQSFDELSVCQDYVIPSGGAGSGSTGTSFAGLWRLAAPLSMINVQDMSGASVGGLQTVILNLTQGQALYAVLNVTSQANATPGASSTSASVSGTPAAGGSSTGASGACTNAAGGGLTTGSTGTQVVVPFTNVSVQTANTTSANPPVIIQAPATKIDAAPNLNSVQVPMWPQMAPPGWNTQINTYWNNAGS